MRAKRFVIVPILLTLACKSPTPAEQMDSIVSWLGTAGMAGDAWLRHTTPDKYTRQTLELSGRRLQEISGELLKTPSATIDTAVLDATLTRSRAHIARMARLVDERNSPGFRRELDSLRIQQKVVRQIADGVESAK